MADDRGPEAAPRTRIRPAAGRHPLIKPLPHALLEDITMHRTLSLIRTLLSLLPLLAWCFTPIVDADVVDLEEGLPLEITDAYPIPLLGREFQTMFRYELDDTGKDQFIIEPRLEIGFPRNAQITVASPFLMGEREPDGVGDVRLEFLYNFNQETQWIPAMSGVAIAEFPSGEDSEGVDPALKFIATKTLPGTWHLHRVHLNGLWQWNDDVQRGERRGRYMVAVGYSVVVTNELVFLADLVRESEMDANIEHNLAEVGLRYYLAPRWVLSGGLGFGFGNESPRMRTTLGVQMTF
jgi:hypothetical protein